ncbi:epoxide hydrolase family protein [Saccharopolyspora gloriosae]|uniref:epoxide hydrolase family protein n=1 Tax=Saccharopolyspora gloriosae TaxID=455344 RepID=UPI001FB83D64|nr:epoxide hydrolase family protein [Saccharopolyspora gloriosae]
MNDQVKNFELQVDQDRLDDLRARLERVRWPGEQPVEDWSQGVPLSYIQDLAAYWADGYDWRRCESRLNAAQQFRTEIDGVDIHFLHARSPHEGALPLILTHGWPGSVREFLDLVEPLTNPPDPADAFHVVIPSLPGFGFSGRPSSTGWGVKHIADAWAELMTRLGYPRFGAHGGDWGSVVSSRLAAVAPDRVVGVHLPIPYVDLAAEPDPPESMNDFEKQGAAISADYGTSGTGYFVEQMTKPQTLGYGLADSPVGQLAWIVEKFHGWTDCAGHPENAVDRNALLDNVMLYWLSNTGASAARIYWESLADLPRDQITVPTGCSIFPKEMIRVPRARAETRLVNIRYWNELPAGGHFASLEQPEIFVGELRKFFRLVR